MVAPTRTPQARGVKCDLCKKILALATWLDQTKLAKEVEEAQTVLNLIKLHQKKECPCIPKNIENLLVGSTHFEIHRILAKKLDVQIYKRQYEHLIDARQRINNESVKNRNQIINDCHDTSKNTRFKVYSEYNDQKHCERSKQQLQYLCNAIDHWRAAMEDLINPFNSKLALRLGLTHHVIYACYLFKYYKALDYQLITANLLLNLFKSIEGVTANAILHANYLVIKTLLDCEQFQLARLFLKQATKCSSYQDKSHYESILLACAEAELELFEGVEAYHSLNELAELVTIKLDDKLQHYYARTLAMSLIIKYIHCYPSKSEQCFEFFHTYRYICAIIRRCFEDSFELVLAEKETLNKQDPKATKSNQILDHSWIRFAICDFVYSTFDLLVEFYSRAGMPESLELLYNGLNLVAFRTGSCYWQSRLVAIGTRLDLLCDKYEHARAKLAVLSRIFGYTSDPHLLNLLRIESEVSLLSILDQEESVIKDEVITDLLKRIKTCKDSLNEKICQIELYDCKTITNFKLNYNQDSNSNSIVLNHCLGKLSLKILKIGLSSLLRNGNSDKARELFGNIANQLAASKWRLLEYHEMQTLVEILVQFVVTERGENFLLKSIDLTKSFLRTKASNELSSLNLQLSTLTLNNDSEHKIPKRKTASNRGVKSTTKVVSKISLSRCSRRKGIYEVAVRSKKSLADGHAIKSLDLSETLANFSTLTNEEILVSYLRNSEPNPDYALYRKVHEVLFSLRLQDTNQNYEQMIYHFSESSTANTLRYRWMMLEEQTISPYHPTKNKLDMGDNLQSTTTRQLSFCNSMTNADKVTKSMLRTIPDDTRLVQFKYILDKKDNSEHLVCCCLEGGNSEPIYFCTKRPLSTDEFFEEGAGPKGDEFEVTSLPFKWSKKIEESRRTLFINNNRSRIEMRQQLETDIGVILHDAENDLLGPFRFILCGKILDTNYTNFITELVDQLQSIMDGYTCASSTALRWFLENAPMLNRDEFCQLIAILFNCPTSSSNCRDCFTKWLNSIEQYLGEHANGMNRTSFMQKLTRGQLGLILDNKLELIPFESFPVVRIIKQGIFRVPSLRLFSALASRQGFIVRVDFNEVAYILDPACNLNKTRERFNDKLQSQVNWLGAIGRAPQVDCLEDWLSRKDVYIFIGHGAGTIYYNKLNKGRGLGFMDHVQAATIVMGCSSGRLQAEGPRLESFGISWLFIFRGAPCYLGLLWDVTDTDIDKYLDSLLSIWMPSKWTNTTTTGAAAVAAESSGNKKLAAKQLNSDCDGAQSSTPLKPITEASALAKQVCQYKFLVGSTPVVYGLPVLCKQNDEHDINSRGQKG